MTYRAQPDAATTAFYWRGRPNFGDLLTPLLLKHFCQVNVEWSPAKDANLFCVGSILEAVPAGSKAIIAGAGKLYEKTGIDHLKKATVLGVRGPLSAQGIRGNICLGDPGLLANELVEVEKTYQLGLIPHWSDTELEHRPEFRKFKPHIIRPAGDPLQVLREIGRCRKVVASSLHGIIVADAFGIPRRTELAKRLASEGGTFKFRDYNASVGVPFELGLTQEAPRYLVQDAQQRIYDMLITLGVTVRKRAA